MEVIEWFNNHKVQRALWTKHCGGLYLLPSCDARYGYNFIAAMKLLRCCMICQKVVGDTVYIDEKFPADTIKPRVNNTGWWNRVADLLQFLFPYLRLLRCGDSFRPMLSKVAGRKMALEAQYEGWLHGDGKTTASGTMITEELRASLIKPIFEAKDIESQSGPTYWENLTSEFALAASVVDPEFHSQKPWLWDGALDAVRAQFEKRYQGETAEKEKELRQLLRELDMYANKTGKLQYGYLWPDASSEDLMPAWMWWGSLSVKTAVPTLSKFAQVQTAQIGSNSPSERAHKGYKFMVNKRSTAKGRDRKNGRGPLAIEQVMLREGLKFISAEEAEGKDLAEVERVLRSFEVGDEAFFLKKFTEVHKPQLQRKMLKNYMEDWEEAAILKKTDRVGAFQLRTKYMGVILRDTNAGEEGDDATYDEVREVSARMWHQKQRGNRQDNSCWQVNTQLIRSITEPGLKPRDVSTNQPYYINSTLHALIADAAADPVKYPEFTQSGVTLVAEGSGESKGDDDDDTSSTLRRCGTTQVFS